jgi:Bacterial Ig domain
LIVTGGRGGSGGEQGVAGTRGAQTTAAGATLKGGAGGAGGGASGAGGEGGQVVGSSTCQGGAVAGASGSAGNSSVGGGGSSFVAPGHLVGGESAGEGDGWLGIEYDDPVTAAAGEYTTIGGQELDVSAGLGVLAGSSSPEPGPPTASLVAPPAHGSLTLEPNGSFTYVPDPGFLGSDSFVYRAADAAGDYADATVVLNIAGPPTAAVSSPSPAGTYVIGQAVKTAFLCSEGPGGPGLLSCDDSSGAMSVTGGVGHLDTATVGHHTYTVTAVSDDGLTGSTSIDYEVVPAWAPGEGTPGGSAAPGEMPGGTPPGQTETGYPHIQFPSPVASRSLRELLRTGRMDVRVRLGAAAKLVLSGRAKLRPGTGRPARPKLVTVLGSKSVSFAAAGERTVALLLTQKGRRALRHLSAVSLVIIAQATDAAGETARKSWPLRLGV